MRYSHLPRRSATWAATLILPIVILASGCGVVGAFLPTDSPTTDKFCASTFKADGRIEKLGSPEKFIDVALSHIAAKSDGITLGSIAREAGWRNDWDRMIQVWPSTTDEAINRSLGTVDICFNRPHERESEDEVIGSYIFFDGSRPVQSMSWRGETEFLRTTNEIIPIRRDEPLIVHSRMLVTERSR